MICKICRGSCRSVRRTERRHGIISLQSASGLSLTPRVSLSANERVGVHQIDVVCGRMVRTVVDMCLMKEERDGR